KFTERGGVMLTMRVAKDGWSRDVETLAGADQVIAFSVRDSGIGIADDKQRIIFEAFQQADGTTSRKYGGTGLGLSISRSLARLLGGEIGVDSWLGEGSPFPLFLPRVYVPATASRALAPASRLGLPQAMLETPSQPTIVVSEAFEDDRDAVQAGDRVLLVIED